MSGRILPIALASLAAAAPFAVPRSVFDFGSTAAGIGYSLLAAGLVLGLSAAVPLRSAMRTGAWKSLWSGPARASSMRIVLYGICGGLVAGSLVPLPPDSHEAAQALTALFRGGVVFGLGWAAQALWARCRRGDAAPASRGAALARFADLVAWTVLTTLLLTETAFVVLKQVAPTPWLFDDATAEKAVDAHRLDPRVSPDMRINSGGFHDDEFFVAGPRDYVATLIGDSFGMGVVPFEFTFATVAERILQERLQANHERVAVHNVSINSSGIREYRYLLERESRPLRPTRVVLCVYVGNDLFDVSDFGRKSLAERIQRVQDWTTGVTLSNVAKALRGMERLDRPPGGVPHGPRPGYDESLRSSMNQPTFTEESYREIVRQRSCIAEPHAKAFELRYATFFAQLDEFVRSAGPGLLVIVAPDEFQVNEAVYSQLTESRGADASPLDRDVPQRRIRDWCAARGVECLDLLPVLRAAEPIHATYVPRDTHWNAWGNLVVGRALAQALLDGAASVRPEECVAEP